MVDNIITRKNRPFKAGMCSYTCNEEHIFLFFDLFVFKLPLGCSVGRAEEWAS